MLTFNLFDAIRVDSIRLDSIGVECGMRNALTFNEYSRVINNVKARIYMAATPVKWEPLRLPF